LCKCSGNVRVDNAESPKSHRRNSQNNPREGGGAAGPAHEVLTSGTRSVDHSVNTANRTPAFFGDWRE
jgi:hypothetical protein